ncbi:MAG: alpha/beta fold hydrolase [Chloroflexi bacterium]|nr:alpha/beta fold hydrolase [Chloroflexota bacterium]
MANEMTITFPSGELTLEGVLSLPQGRGPFPGVVICHPHPLMGGTMDNNVVTEIASALSRRNIAVLRFNFRGVRGSQGSFGEGVGETADALAAVSFLSSQRGVNPNALAIVGYSFGAAVALSAAAKRDSLRGAAAISPPISFFPLDFLKDYHRPVLFLCGSRDHIVQAEDLRELVKGLPGPQKLAVVPGADHFWWGQEESMAGEVADFLVDILVTESV